MTPIEDLCQGMTEEVQQKIKAAYWIGCSEGIIIANTSETKIDRQEGNVVYLHKSSRPERWFPSEL